MTLRRIVTLALTALLAGGGLAVPGCSGGGAERSAARKYHCPMHPTYVSDRPGDCPICGMKLVPMEEKPATPAAKADAAPAPSRPADPEARFWCPMHPEVTSRVPGAICEKCGGMKLVPVPSPEPSPAPAASEVVYTCPMHPEVKSKRPGRCPICGMDLRPSTEPKAAPAPEPHRHESVPRTEVTIAPEKLQLIGVKTEAVAERTVDRTVRTVGRVDFDETRLHHVHAKFEGYIEKLHVNFTGKHVRKGEPLLSIYSPELVASQNEYLLARKAAARMATDGSLGDKAVESARKRLLFWDISPREIERLEREGEALRTVTLHARHSGIVLKKLALEGARVTPGETLFELGDLSRVWVLADVYERELPFIHLKQSARVTVASVPGRSWEGMVTYIYPTVDEKSRTIKVRVELDNPKGLLKPGMFADVELRSRTGTVRRLAVPESAIVHTGTRALVFVARGGGRFEPRRIEAGERTADYVEVLGGVSAGEQVVVGANFLLDSESRLRAAIDAMTAGGGHAH